MSEHAAPAGDSTAPAAHFAHLAIAEQGKVYALEGQHALALAYYREAIRLTVQSGEPEIVFRHYLECVLESLERMGAYQDVLNYCGKALDLFATAPDTPHTSLERAHVYQRQGAVQLKAGDRDGAGASLRKAVESAASQRFSLALANTLLGWIERGLQVDPRRVSRSRSGSNTSMSGRTRSTGAVR